LLRVALKLATGAGKTTVMAMLIAWQTINSVRRSQSSRFSRGFLVVTSGLTIKDRLRFLDSKAGPFQGVRRIGQPLGEFREKGIPDLTVEWLSYT